MSRTALFLFVAFALLNCSSPIREEADRTEPADPGMTAAARKKGAVRKPAAQFSLQDADGKTVTLTEYKGKVVLLNFWATWCGPCKIEIPWFAEFERKYKDRGFAVLGVAMDDEGWSAVKPYLAKNKITYRIIAGNDKVAESYGGVESLPTTFIVDREGMIAAEHQGLVGKDEYEKEIVGLLDKRTDRRGSSGADGVALARANHP